MQTDPYNILERVKETSQKVLTRWKEQGGLPPNVQKNLDRATTFASRAKDMPLEEFSAWLLSMADEVLAVLALEVEPSGWPESHTTRYAEEVHTRAARFTATALIIRLSRP